MPITIDLLIPGIGGDNLRDSAGKLNGNFDAIAEMLNDILETHAARHVLGGDDEVDGDTLSITYTPDNYTPVVETDITTDVDELSSHLKGIDTAFTTKSDTDHNHDSDYAVIGHDHNSSYSVIGHDHDSDYADINHDASHITSGADEIDGDKLDIDWNPTNYTPATVENYADSVDNLTAHLKGVDTKFGNIGIFNVKDYGAAGDGVTDDTDAINTTITSALASTPIGTVYFPCGIYKTTGAHEIPAGSTGLQICGEGIRVSQILINHATNNVFDVTSGALEGFVMRDLTVTSIPINETTCVDYSGQFFGSYPAETLRTDGWVFSVATPSWLMHSKFENIEVVGQRNGFFIHNYSAIKFINVRGHIWTGPMHTVETWESGSITAGSLFKKTGVNDRWFYSLIDGTSTVAPTSNLTVNTIETLSDSMVWAAVSPHITGCVSVRTDSTAYNCGQIIKLSGDETKWYYCISAGTSAASPPTFNTTVGQTTSDGNITWKCVLAEPTTGTGGKAIQLGTSATDSGGWTCDIVGCYFNGFRNATGSYSGPTALDYGVYSYSVGGINITNSTFVGIGKPNRGATVYFNGPNVGDGSVRQNGLNYINNCHFDSSGGIQLFVGYSRFLAVNNSQFFDAGLVPMGSATAFPKEGADYATSCVLIEDSFRNIISNCLFENNQGVGVVATNSWGTMSNCLFDHNGNSKTLYANNAIYISQASDGDISWVITGCTDKETTSSGTTPWSIQMINCSRAVITGNYLGNDVQYWGATPVASGNYIPS